MQTKDPDVNLYHGGGRTFVFTLNRDRNGQPCQKPFYRPEDPDLMDEES